MQIKETNNETIINEWLDQLREYNRENTADRNDLSGKIHFVAMDEDNQILGLLQAEYNWEWLFIKNLIVNKDHRHKGVGTELLKKGRIICCIKKMSFNLAGYIYFPGTRILRKKWLSNVWKTTQLSGKP